jgi:hypothetical protein
MEAFRNRRPESRLTAFHHFSLPMHTAFGIVTGEPVGICNNSHLFIVIIYTMRN